jgi:hypothetical protein
VKSVRLEYRAHACSLLAQPFDGFRLQLQGEPVSIAERVNSGGVRNTIPNARRHTKVRGPKRPLLRDANDHMIDAKHDASRTPADDRIAGD